MLRRSGLIDPHLARPRHGAFGPTMCTHPQVATSQAHLAARARRGHAAIFLASSSEASARIRSASSSLVAGIETSCPSHYKRPLPSQVADALAQRIRLDDAEVSDTQVEQVTQRLFCGNHSGILKTSRHFACGHRGPSHTYTGSQSVLLIVDRQSNIRMGDRPVSKGDDEKSAALGSL